MDNVDIIVHTATQVYAWLLVAQKIKTTTKSK